MKEIEDLLKPRWKCILGYPRMEQDKVRVGDILTLENLNERLVKNHTEYYNKYPHLFQPLAWWMDRKVEDMPEYVKSLTNQEYYKVVKSNEISFSAVQEMKGGWGIDYPWDNVLPATLQDYQSFIENKKVK